MRWKGFYIGRAQSVAAVLLLLMLGECLWLVARTPLATSEYRYARCGREMWERPSPLAGYFTTCGNLNGDGTFAYRLAALPLSVERWTLLATDHFRKPENRVYAGGGLNGTIWESRHELRNAKWFLRLPFVLFALWLGAGLWWVSRRLFGNEGGAVALGLYVVCPAVLRAATVPNNDVLAMWGLYGLLYTAIGVAHALQGPKRKWKPRILLLTFALGMTAAAHLLAACIGFIAGAVFLFYLAERRRSYIAQILVFSAVGATVVLFAAFSFRPSAFLYVFTGGSVRSWFSLEGFRLFATKLVGVKSMGGALLPVHGPILLGTLAALAVFAVARRSRYFGNTAPLVMALLLFPVYTTQVQSAPWIWALPFLFTFLGGVFADVLEGPRRRVWLMATAAMLVAQAGVCVAWLAA